MFAEFGSFCVSCVAMMRCGFCFLSPMHVSVVPSSLRMMVAW